MNSISILIIGACIYYSFHVIGAKIGAIFFSDKKEEINNV